MEDLEEERLTMLLKKWQAGSQEALDTLESLVGPVLLAKARRLLQRELYKTSMTATELVQEAWLRLLDSGTPEVKDHFHFINLLSRVMRRILINQGVARKANKRCSIDGKAINTVALENPDEVVGCNPNLRYELEHALYHLQQVDPRKERIVALYCLWGFAQLDIAEMEKVSLSTVKRELQVAFSWLRTRMKGVRHLA